MKRLLYILAIFFAAALPAKAQFSSYGVNGAIGYSYITDDIIAAKGLLSYSGGISITYGFDKAKSVMADYFFIRSGLNLVHRGGFFEADYKINATTSMHRSGYYKAYYLQLPILPSVRFDFSNSNAKQYLVAYLGPALCFGVFGKFSDECVDADHPLAAINYKIIDDPVFDHANRFDLDAILGVAYQYNNWELRAYMDYGFLSLGDIEDVLKTFENQQQGTNEKTTIPTGNVVSFMFSLGYNFPIR